jgi:hypothetical protein
MDALTRRGPSETKALKLTTGFAQPKMRTEFDRAMKELQEKFLALKVEERYDPFTYVWNTVEHQWTDAMRAARRLAPARAAYSIVQRYYEIAGYGNERSVTRMLGLDSALVERSARKLEKEHIVRRNMRVAGYRETLTLLAKFV